MKTLKFLFCLMAFAVLGVIQSAAERVKPELPAPATIEEGVQYYLYNESVGKFMGNGTGNYYLATYYPGYTFSFVFNSDGTISIKRTDGEYVCAYNSNGNLQYESSIYSCCKFRYSKLEDGCYQFQRNYNYVDSLYIGAFDGSSWFTHNATKNTKWHMVPADNKLACARLGLYNALEQYEYPEHIVKYYDDLLVNSNDATALINAAKDITKGIAIEYQRPWWGDCDIVFFNDPNKPAEFTNGNSFRKSANKDYNTKVKGFVKVDFDDAMLTFDLKRYDSNSASIKFYIDGEQYPIKTYYLREYNTEYNTYGFPLSKGNHTIEWEIYNAYSDGYSYGLQVYDIGIHHADKIVVNLLEPGSLGSEVLSHVNHVKDVTDLKVIGEMNAADWNVLHMMTNIVTLDLSEAVVTSIPNSQFSVRSALYEFKFPKKLQSIGNEAFKGTAIFKVDLPETVTTIGDGAFRECRGLCDVDLRSQVKSIPNNCFYNSYILQHVVLPDSLTSIGESSFRSTRIDSLNLPSTLKTIGDYAFYDSWINYNRVEFPASLNSIGYEAFYYASFAEGIKFAGAVSIGAIAFGYAYIPGMLEIPTGSSINSYSFSKASLDSVSILGVINKSSYSHFEGSSVKYIELGTNEWLGDRMFKDCSSLQTIKLMRPSVVGSYGFNNIPRGNITLLVPDFLVNSYKLDSFWYTCKEIKGFATSEVKDWYIDYPVVLDSKSRLQGTPNIHLSSASLTMKGDLGMDVNDVNLLWNCGKDNSFSSSSQVLSSADINIKGNLTLQRYTYANRWYFMALPFDMKVGDIQTSAQYAIRYYDGANRAATLAASGNWKNYTADDVIPAGTGFAYQTSQDGWTYFKAVNNADKNRAFKNKDLSKSLKEHACGVSEHRGWNLVGNPWMTYYNIHSLDFTAPITVYDAYNKKYIAYSIIDDDVALYPTQAFFVQCPEDIAAITFPTRGRQLTSQITNQNGTQHLQMRGAVQGRQLIDLQIVDGNEADDPTRIVLNEDATLGYDYGSDASKFFAEGSALQLYTLNHEGEMYAINERPVDDSMVNLGFIAPADGSYTIRLKRNQAAEVYLTDRSTGKTVDLTKQDYIFTCKAGEHTNRLVLALKADPTGIAGTLNAEGVAVVEGGLQTTVAVKVYGMDGRQLAEGTGYVALPKGMYVVKAGEQATKVVVK